MIDVQTVRCPDCGHSFDFSSYVGEEPLDSNVRLTKKLAQRTSWEELETEICSGRAALCLDVGDKLEFELKNGKKVSVEVAAVNPYGDNVAFSFANVLQNGAMNSTDTNRGGFCESKMADILEKEILPLLPDELAEVITPRKSLRNYLCQVLLEETKESLKESASCGFRHIPRFLGIMNGIADVISGMYAFHYLQHAEEEQSILWMMIYPPGGCVLRMSATPRTSGLSAAAAAATAAARPAWVASAPASLSEGSPEAMQMNKISGGLPASDILFLLLFVKNVHFYVDIRHCKF